MRLFKQLLSVFAVLGVLVGTLMIFAYDVIKIDWVVFMEIQDSYGSQEKPLPVPALSIPVEGPAYLGDDPVNPIAADADSISRGAQLYGIHCAMCHGDGGQGTGTVSAFLIKKKPADLTSAVVQEKSDGSMFLSITNGISNPENSFFPEVEFSGQMPPLKENLTVRERWDVVNYLRTLSAGQ